MDSIFNFSKNNESNNFNDKIDMDELYETQRKTHDVKISQYNKILQRIHAKIKLASRHKTHNNFCSFHVSEYMYSSIKHNYNECIEYLVDKLTENKFVVNYIHPHLLVISWAHFVPSYIRKVIKQKTGVSIDEYGNKVESNSSKIKPISNESIIPLQHKPQEIEEIFNLHTSKHPPVEKNTNSFSYNTLNNNIINTNQPQPRYIRPLNNDNTDNNNSFAINTQPISSGKAGRVKKPEKSFTPISNYKPSGGLLKPRL